MKLSYTIYFFIFIIISGAIYMYLNSQNQMAVIVTPKIIKDTAMPDEKVYFDASEWLDQKNRYIKISDFHMIDLAFKPLEVKQDSYRLFKYIHEHIRINQSGLRGIEPLANMKRTDPDFYNTLYETNMQTEYLSTSFDKKTFKPTIDNFLLRFTYNNAVYEIYLKRYSSDDEEDRYNPLLSRKGLGYIRKHYPEYFIYENYVTKHNLVNRNITNKND